MRRDHRLAFPLLFVALGLLCAAAEMADEMLLKTKGAEEGVVTLNHKAHALERSMPCLRCHHNMAEEGTPPCNQCHTLAGEAQVSDLQTAYHDSCQGCHSAPPKGKTPPMECGGCHEGSTSVAGDASSGSAKGSS